MTGILANCGPDLDHLYRAPGLQLQGVDTALLAESPRIFAVGAKTPHPPGRRERSRLQRKIRFPARTPRCERARRERSRRRIPPKAGLAQEEQPSLFRVGLIGARELPGSASVRMDLLRIGKSQSARSRSRTRRGRPPGAAYNAPAQLRLVRVGAASESLPRLSMLRLRVRGVRTQRGQMPSPSGSRDRERR